MARDNYSYRKHMREVLKKKKKEEKAQRKLDKKNLEAKGDSGQVSGEVASSSETA